MFEGNTAAGLPHCILESGVFVIFPDEVIGYLPYFTLLVYCLYEVISYFHYAIIVM